MSDVVHLHPQANWRTSICRFVGVMPLSVRLSLIWLLGMVFIAIFADVLAPYEVEAIHLQDRLAEPGTPGYWLGTDKLGRDILTRLFYSIRISMIVATLSTLIGGVAGTLLGLLAAEFRGLVDDVVMLLVDFQGALPSIIFAVALLALFGNSLTLFVIVLGILGWQVYARLARGTALSTKAESYIESAIATGASRVAIYRRHVLPNIANVLMVNLTLNFPATILAEASLSFLGLGIQPPDTSLGLMVSIGRDYLAQQWWIAGFPGMVIFCTTLSVAALGDWLRDRLDPTTR
jgi:peptide/nickel transport system permease protein